MALRGTVVAGTIVVVPVWGLCHGMVCVRSRLRRLMLVFGTPFLFMHAWACVAFSGWRVGNSSQDDKRKYFEASEWKNMSPVHPATTPS